MAYTKTNWVNDSQPPISADNLNNMENGIFNANALADNIDDAYDDTATYAVGDYAIYNNTLYKCITAVTSAEPFDSSKWSSVSVMDEIGQNASAISALNSSLSDTCKMKEIAQTWESTTSGTTYIVGVVNALLGLTPSSACIGSVAIGGDSAIDTDGTLFINAGTVYYKCGYTQNNTQATFCLIYK